jgi:hypothetical protein
LTNIPRMRGGKELWIISRKHVKAVTNIASRFITAHLSVSWSVRIFVNDKTITGATFLHRTANTWSLQASSNWKALSVHRAAFTLGSQRDIPRHFKHITLHHHVMTSIAQWFPFLLFPYEVNIRKLLSVIFSIPLTVILPISRILSCIICGMKSDFAFYIESPLSPLQW